MDISLKRQLLKVLWNSPRVPHFRQLRNPEGEKAAALIEELEMRVQELLEAGCEVEFQNDQVMSELDIVRQQRDDAYAALDLARHVLTMIPFHNDELDSSIAVVISVIDKFGRLGAGKNLTNI